MVIVKKKIPTVGTSTEMVKTNVPVVQLSVTAMAQLLEELVRIPWEPNVPHLPIAHYLIKIAIWERELAVAMQDLVEKTVQVLILTFAKTISAEWVKVIVTPMTSVIRRQEPTSDVVLTIVQTVH